MKKILLFIVLLPNIVFAGRVGNLFEINESGTDIKARVGDVLTLEISTSREKNGSYFLESHSDGENVLELLAKKRDVTQSEGEEMIKFKVVYMVKRPGAVSLNTQILGVVGNGELQEFKYLGVDIKSAN